MWGQIFFINSQFYFFRWSFAGRESLKITWCWTFAEWEPFRLTMFASSPHREQRKNCLCLLLFQGKKYESQGTILPVRGGGPRSGGGVAKPSNEYQILLLKPDNFSLTKGGGLINFKMTYCTWFNAEVRLFIFIKSKWWKRKCED